MRNHHTIADKAEKHPVIALALIEPDEERMGILVVLNNDSYTSSIQQLLQEEGLTKGSKGTLEYPYGNKGVRPYIFLEYEDMDITAFILEDTKVMNPAIAEEATRWWEKEGKALALHHAASKEHGFKEKAETFLKSTDAVSGILSSAEYHLLDEQRFRPTEHAQRLLEKRREKGYGQSEGSRWER